MNRRFGVVLVNGIEVAVVVDDPLLIDVLVNQISQYVLGAGVRDRVSRMCFLVDQLAQRCRDAVIASRYRSPTPHVLVESAIGLTPVALIAVRIVTAHCNRDPVRADRHLHGLIESTPGPTVLPTLADLFGYLAEMRGMIGHNNTSPTTVAIRIPEQLQWPL